MEWISHSGILTVTSVWNTGETGDIDFPGQILVQNQNTKPVFIQIPTVFVNLRGI